MIYKGTCPHRAECPAVFDHRWNDLLLGRVPHHPYSPDLAPSDFSCVCPQMKKVLKGKRFADVEEVKQTYKKRQKHEKASKSTHSEASLSSRKNVLIGVLHQMECTLKVTEV